MHSFSSSLSSSFHQRGGDAGRPFHSEVARICNPYTSKDTHTHTLTQDELQQWFDDPQGMSLQDFSAHIAQKRQQRPKKTKEQAARFEVKRQRLLGTEPTCTSKALKHTFDELLRKIYYEDKDSGARFRGRDPLFYRIQTEFPEYNRKGLSRRYIADWLNKQEVHSVFKAGPALAKQRSIQRIVTKGPFRRLNTLILLTCHQRFTLTGTE